MKKNGFVFIETIVVISILITLLITVYIPFSTILNNYRISQKFDQTIYMYKAKIMRDFLKRNGIYDISTNLTSRELYEINCDDSLIVDSSSNDSTDVCNIYINNLEINKMYLLSTSTSDITTEDNRIKQYLKTINFNSDNRYLLIIKFNNGNISGLHLNLYNEIEQETFVENTSEPICLANFITSTTSNYDPYVFNTSTTSNKLPDNVKSLKKLILDGTAYDIKCDEPSLSKIAISSSYLNSNSSLWKTTSYTINENYIYQVKDYETGYFSYSFRGYQNNNYIKFNGSDILFRILKVTPDGIKIVMDEPSQDLYVTISEDYIINNYDNKIIFNYNYNQDKTDSDGSSYNEKNYIVSILDNYYENNLKTVESINNNVVNGKYCIDDITNTSNSYNDGNGYVCNNLFENKIGLLTVDDINIAGSVYNTRFNNESFFLYNDNIYNNVLTFTYYKENNNIYNYVLKSKCSSYIDTCNQGTISKIGMIYSNQSLISDKSFILKPVLNLKSDTEFSSGSGTKSNPYVIGG